MELLIKGRHLDVSEPLRAYTVRRLRFALGPFARQLINVEVRLADTNGPRGGIDKACAVKVLLRTLTVVFAKAEGTDIYSTVDRAATRVRTAVSRSLSRRRADRRDVHQGRSFRSGDVENNHSRSGGRSAMSTT